MKNFTRAIALAEEHATLIARGDVVLAEQARRTLDSLVGYWDERGKAPVFRLPARIAEIAGLRA